MLIISHMRYNLFLEDSNFSIRTRGINPITQLSQVRLSCPRQRPTAAKTPRRLEHAKLVYKKGAFAAPFLCVDKYVQNPKAYNETTCCGRPAWKAWRFAAAT